MKLSRWGATIFGAMAVAYPPINTAEPSMPKTLPIRAFLLFN
jgi:hypothetical protein